MTTDFDYLIVGQGIAGSILAYMLEKKGKRVFIVDKFSPNSSSQVAAGLVNPITGRRIVKTWMADEAIPFAKEFYSAFGKEFGEKLFHSIDTLEVTGSVHEWNEWTTRMNEQNMQNYFNEDAPNEVYRGKIRDFIKLVRITSSGWLDMPLFTRLIRNKWLEKNHLLDELFEADQLLLEENRILYKEIVAKQVIFCEGYKCLSNKFWETLPFLPAKGEIVVIESKDLPEDFMIMSGMFIIPIGNHQFRCGATYEWKFKDELPTESGKEKLIDMLSNNLKVEFKIIHHTAGVRPTVKDRRPIIGHHKKYKNVSIFNGLGTKGVLLSPYFANHFVEHLEDGSDLMKEVDVKRFES